MKIKVIHTMTGSSEEFLRKEHDLLKSFAKPDTDFDIIKVKRGAASIESRFDEYVGAVECFHEVIKAEREGYDGVIITCFGNANMDPSREIVDIPVVASGLASMMLAASLGQRFAVLGTLDSAKDRHEFEAWKLGVERKFVERPVRMNVLTLHDNEDQTFQNLLRTARECIEKDGAQVIVPGCFGMIGMAARLQTELGVPVIEPAGAVVKLIETLVDLNLSQSKLAYPTPPAKPRDYNL